jgi:pimeloyl-ACP methyl ester carboxylesterase
MAPRVTASCQATWLDRTWPQRKRNGTIPCLSIAARILVCLMSAAVMLVAGAGAPVAGAPGAAAEAVFSECGEIGDVGAEYCYHKIGTQPKYTIWFFHGYGDSQHGPANSFFDQESYKAFEAGLSSVNLVLISFGPSWLLTAYPGREKDPANATVDAFKTQIVPFMERKYRLARPYVVMGQSMGAFSAATLCAAAPAMWSKCVLVNPMLPSCDPFRECAPKGPIPMLPGCDLLHVFDCNIKKMGAGLLIRANFSEEGWQQTRPMVLLQRAARLPKTYVTVCMNDKIVESRGAEEWINLAKSKNADSKWDPVTACSHFEWPHQHVLDFLAR